MSRPKFGESPIKCGNRKCDWTGKETELVEKPRAEKVGAISVLDNVCPKCGCDNYTFPRRKCVGSASSYNVTEPSHDD